MPENLALTQAKEPINLTQLLSRIMILPGVLTDTKPLPYLDVISLIKPLIDKEIRIDLSMPRGTPSLTISYNRQLPQLDQAVPIYEAVLTPQGLQQVTEFRLPEDDTLIEGLAYDGTTGQPMWQHELRQLGQSSTPLRRETDAKQSIYAAGLLPLPHPESLDTLGITNHILQLLSNQ